MAEDTSQQDHPRICGEKPLLKNFPASEKGSPPHMRGKVSVTVRDQRVSGITPAYAGKSDTIFEKFGQDKDHPRICGEKTISEYATAAEQGSPPHMRGKAVIAQKRGKNHGITPAYAGKRIRSSVAQTAL